MSRQPERTAKTKQLLMDSFWKLYCEKRIEKITIKEICAGAGFYRSTFYEYFTDIYDVLENIESGLLEQIREILKRNLASRSVPEMLKNVLPFYEKNGAYIIVLLGAGGDQHFSIRLKELVKSTFLSELSIPEDDPEIDLVIEMFASIVISILNYWYTHRDTISLNEVLATSSVILQQGFVPHIRKWGFEVLP